MILGGRVPARPRRDEGEKPFWISFADLMTGMMVLFLVAMAVAVLAVTSGLARLEASKKARQATIDSCLGHIGTLTRESRFRGVELAGDSIRFGALAEFERGKSALTAGQSAFLRSFVPPVLRLAGAPDCDSWIKRVVVEGYASQEGSYLYNLNLSFQRAQRVLCVLLDRGAANAPSQDERRRIRSLFVASGASFNQGKRTNEESRRVELTLEFRELDERRGAAAELPWDDDSRCPSDYA